MTMDYERMGIPAPDPHEHPAVDAGRWTLAWKMARICRDRGITAARVATWSDRQWLFLANQVPRKKKRTEPLSTRTKLICLGYLRNPSLGGRS